MSLDITGSGIVATVVASVTFPGGIQVSQFADDADPFDVSAQDITSTAMTLNGDLLGWSVANPIVVNLNVIPGSPDDVNLAIIGENNRIGRGKQSARDQITLTAVYPDGRSTIFSSGFMTNIIVANSVASEGRLKSKTYVFAFENKSEVAA